MGGVGVENVAAWRAEAKSDSLMTHIWSRASCCIYGADRDQIGEPLLLQGSLGTTGGESAHRLVMQVCPPARYAGVLALIKWPAASPVTFTVTEHFLSGLLMGAWRI